MTTTMIPAEAFPPGELLRDELADRGWAEGEFAEIIGRPVQAVSEILNGKKEITPETAVAIAAALGTSAELWLNLQASYRLHQIRSQQAPALKPVQRRARLRSLIPVRELQKRSWLPTTDDIDVLERAVCDFLHIKRLDEEPNFAIAARRSNAGTSLTPEQTAWVARIEQLGAGQASKPFDVGCLSELAANLARRLEGPKDLAHLREWVEQCGVTLIIELPLRNSKIDGVVSFAADNPIIGLSTRGNRMDSFVFTLLHEIAHLVLGHVTQGALRIDEDVQEGTDSGYEDEANERAGTWIFPTPFDLPSRSPLPSELVDLARAHSIHPCFVVGRLQNDGRLEWSDYRRTIPKVRPYVKLG